MDEKAAIELARSYARNCNIVEHAAHKYLQNVDAKWQPHEWVVRAILAAHRQGTQAAAPTRVLTEHNGYYWGGPHETGGRKQMATAIGAYRDLWKSINGAESWDANPWVWAVSFKRIGA